MTQTEEQIALARRAVACKGWRWMPGMLHGMVVGGKLTSCYRIGDLTLYLDADRVPDLTDPATLGCVMALYEETRETLCCPDPVYTMAAAWGLMHPRTIEALIAALEAAPPSDQEREK